MFGKLADSADFIVIYVMNIDLQLEIYKMNLALIQKSQLQHITILKLIQNSLLILLLLLLNLQFKILFSKSSFIFVFIL